MNIEVFGYKEEYLVNSGEQPSSKLSSNPLALDGSIRIPKNALVLNRTSTEIWHHVLQCAIRDALENHRRVWAIESTRHIVGQLVSHTK